MVDKAKLTLTCGGYKAEKKYRTAWLKKLN